MDRAQVSKDVIRASYLEQAKLTQAHAWLALGLHDVPPKERLQQLQSKQFQIVVAGPDPSFGSNLSDAERVNLLRTASLEDHWSLEAGDALRVRGVVADLNAEGSRFNAVISFHFETDPALLPRISKIEIAVADPSDAPNVPADLVKSRLVSTNHRWHTLVENPNRSPEPFKELLGERFKMEFGHGSVNSYDEFEKWVYGSASSVNASRHDMESVSWRRLDGNEFEAVFILDWLGLNKDDKVMVAKTKHTWTLSDDPSESYPRIQHMDVLFLEPFTVID